MRIAVATATAGDAFAKDAFPMTPVKITGKNIPPKEPF